MKNRNGMYITNIVVLIAGVLLIILHDRVNIMAGIVIIMGIMFLIPSAINLLMIMIQRGKNNVEDDAKQFFLLNTVSSIGGLCLGIFLIAMPDIFIGILAYMFAGILLIAGIYHIVFLVISSKIVKMPLWFYILPSLTTIAGLVIIFSSVRTIESVVVLITGISLVCFTINSVLEYFGLKAVKKDNLIM
ncbi:MAG: DUF308 domain-containing protein [Muribaculaceae bacterium]